jgi:hypothetical protein
MNNLRRLRAICIALLLTLAAGAGATQPITVRVNENRVLFTTPDRFHGTNYVALWNNRHDSAGAVRAFSQMGMTLLRFPGGVPAHWYDWETPLATGWTPMTPERVYRFARAGGAQMIFQTNTATDQTATSRTTGRRYSFSSSGEHAANWVRAARQQGISVAFWEIGNEPEMDAPKEHKASQEAIYRWYNAKFAEQARAMKQADPSIRIMGPASTNTWFWWGQHNLEKFLIAHGNRRGTGLVDAVSLHWYPQGGEKAWEQTRGYAQGWKECMEYIRSTIQRYDSRPLPVYITEWNWGAGDKNLSGRRLSNALGNADCIGMFLQTGVSGHTHFCLQRINRNWGVLATKDDSRPADEASPTYYALQMASHLYGQVLETQSGADPKHVLSAYATRRSGEIQMMLINKTEKPQDVRVQFARYNPAGKQVRVYSLRGVNNRINDEDVIYNGVTHPSPATRTLPEPTRVAGQQPFRYAMSPFSMLVLIFPER